MLAMKKLAKRKDVTVTFIVPHYPVVVDANGAIRTRMPISTRKKTSSTARTAATNKASSTSSDDKQEDAEHMTKNTEDQDGGEWIDEGEWIDDVVLMERGLAEEQIKDLEKAGVHVIPEVAEDIFAKLKKLAKNLFSKKKEENGEKIEYDSQQNTDTTYNIH